MPPCHCSSHNCRGQIVTERTIKNHQREDLQHAITSALNATDDALRAQDEQLATAVTSLALSDDSLSRHDDDFMPFVAPTAAVPLVHIQESSLSSTQHPASSSDTWSTLEDDLTSFASTLQAQLDVVRAPSTRSDAFPFMYAVEDLDRLKDRLARLPRFGARNQQHKLNARLRIETLSKMLIDARRSWNTHLCRFQELTSRIPSYDTAQHFDSILQGAEPLVQITMFTMVALQIILHLPRRGCHFLLSMIRFIVQLALSRNLNSISSHDASFVANMPVDPVSVTEKFPLEGKDTVYAVCPNDNCHKLYPPKYRQGFTLPEYPEVCTYQQYPSSGQCGTVLTKGRKIGSVVVQVPIKRHVGFSFKDYLANLLSRPGFETQMDNPETSQTDTRHDVHDGNFLRNFTYKDQTKFRSTVEVGHYTFSISLDFFNPFENSSASLGVISVVCLSLPAAIRYHVENMFLAGVIPGPHEPPLTATNHYLSPIVDEFLVFWDPGVHFSRTHNHPKGRLVQAAMVLAICDVLAARKAAGFASCTSEIFCTVCHCTLSKEGYGDTSYHNWRRRTDEEWREAAGRFREAPDPATAERVFKSTGHRWTELLRLPYFDVTRCVVVDSMHNLFLGLLMEHFRGILGIGREALREKVIELDLSTDAAAQDFKETDLKGIRRLKGMLEAPHATSFPTRQEGVKKLAQVNATALAFVCGIVKCPMITKDTTQKRKKGNPYTKAEYATSLYEWRVQQKETRTTGAVTSTACGHVLNQEEMVEIWSDLEETLTPSWLTSVPHNLGSASHGTLKADQWRVLGTVHLPLSLIHIWGTPDPLDPRAQRCRRILDVTLSLMTAVTIATSRTITAEQATSYLAHMTDYVNGIKELFPEYKIRPNHHLAFHIYDFLLLFGPVYSWWTYPFERLIGALTRMPHNSVIGEMEETIARAYTRACSLRAMLSKYGCPEVIQNTLTIFQKLVDPQLRGTLQTDIHTLSAVLEDNSAEPDVGGHLVDHIPDDLRLSFQDQGVRWDLKPRIYLRSNISIGGLTYSAASKHQGNSCVLIASPLGDTPAQIIQIVQLVFSDNSVTTYLGVIHRKSLSLHHNPYKCYPVLRAELWSAEFEPIKMVSVDKLVSHYACLPITPNIGQHMVAVMPLWRRGARPA